MNKSQHKHKQTPEDPPKLVCEKCKKERETIVYEGEVNIKQEFIRQFLIHVMTHGNKPKTKEPKIIWDLKNT